jgi:hypothetical protein
MKVEPADLSDRGWDPSEDVDAEPANDDEEVISLEVWHTDYLDRKLFCVVGWNGATQCADWVDVFDENGSKVECDFATREAIVAKAVM